MKLVDEATFWQRIKKTTLNVHPRIDGRYPYTSVFINQYNGQEFGRIERKEETPGTVVEQHYLMKI